MRLLLLLSLSIIAASSIQALAQEPASRTVIEEMIAAQNPCASLRTEIAGQTIGIDKLQDVVLREADATLRGDDVSLNFSGRLACETSGSAFLAGDASAAVDASAQLSFANCDAATLEVRLSDFGGSFAAVLGALRQAIELQIADSARPLLIEACRNLRG